MVNKKGNIVIIDTLPLLTHSVFLSLSMNQLSKMKNIIIKSNSISIQIQNI